ncbi:hypothetical protein [Paenibacillus sp. SN-8-1]|uniref:hypothetical protein n=1 Tax=Paenibacillus sp. SN-8-1 TaxID=3435409 RepID=UPI003D9A1BFA
MLRIAAAWGTDSFGGILFLLESAYFGGYRAYIRDSRDRYLSKTKNKRIVLQNNRMRLQFLQSEGSLVI